MRYYYGCWKFTGRRIDQRDSLQGLPVYRCNWWSKHCWTVVSCQSSRNPIHWTGHSLLLIVDSRPSWSASCFILTLDYCRTFGFVFEMEYPKAQNPWFIVMFPIKVPQIQVHFGIPIFKLSKMIMMIDGYSMSHCITVASLILLVSYVQRCIVFPGHRQRATQDGIVSCVPMNCAFFRKAIA